MGIRPSLAIAIRWIALNDEPTCLDQAAVSQLLTVALTADLFEMEPLAVARMVIAGRKATLGFRPATGRP
jgi:hypothetical protein